MTQTTLRTSALAAALALPAAAQEPAPVTFTEHIAPLVFAHCAQCHREGEVAPFPLLTYRDVQKRGPMIVKVTQRRYMPPWLPVEGHGTFAGSLRLADDDIALLARWVDGGMVEGDLTKLPPMPKFTPGWQLGEPDLVVAMPEGFDVPERGADIYRSFVIPLDLDEDKWVTAIEVRPSARSVLHHIVFGLDESGEARKRDGADGKPGFANMGGLDGARTFESGGLGGWAVGGMPRHLPDGLAMRLKKGTDLILNSHFHPSGKAENERTTLGFYLTDKAPKRSLHALQLPPMFGYAAGLDVPAGEAGFELRDSFTLPVDAEAISVGGHAHMICQEMEVVVTPPEGEPRSIFLIDDWDFDWQNRYQYERAEQLPKGTRVDVRIRYDNSAQNPDNPFDPPRRVRWGLQSTEEMGSVSLLLVPKDEKDAEELRRAIRQKRRDALNGPAERSGSALINGIVSRIRTYDRDGDGKVTITDLPERLQRVGRAADGNVDGVLDDAEIEAAAERAGR